jgi:hypothetical protein
MPQSRLFAAVLRTAPAANGRLRLLRHCARPAFASERLAALVPPPRRHRHHYHGVFAPHAASRAGAPPELDTDRGAGAAFAFDQSPSRDLITPPVRNQDTRTHALPLTETGVWTSYHFL